MTIDANNLSQEEKQLIKQYDEEHKIKGSFSKFLTMGSLAVGGAFFGASAPLVTLILVEAAINLPKGPVAAAVTTAATIVGVGVGVIGGLYAGNALHKEHNENIEKENSINKELSPEELIKKKISVMSNINAIREKAEKAEMEYKQKLIKENSDRNDALMGIGSRTHLGLFR